MIDCKYKFISIIWN